MVVKTMKRSDRTNLTQLAKRANHYHRRIVKRERANLQDAKEAGDALNAALAIVGWGPWGDWLKENFEGSEDSARNYRDIATNWQLVKDQPSINAALRLIRGGDVAGKHDWLRLLEMVAVALGKEGKGDQGDCFVVKGDQVHAYNGEFLCRAPSPFGDDFGGDFHGAMKAAPLLKLLGRPRPGDDLDVALRVMDQHDGMWFFADGWGGWVPIEEDFILDTADVEEPGRWKPLPAEFGKAVQMVASCAGTDGKYPRRTCVHVTSEFVEATDDHQLCRYKVQTNVKRACLVRQSAIRHVTTLGMTEVSETKAWVHFKNPTGLILSCRRYPGGYFDLAPQLRVQGEPLTLPKALRDAVGPAEFFAPPSDDPLVTVKVELRTGRLWLMGDGPRGRFIQTVEVKYQGPSLTFLVSPRVLLEVVNRRKEARVTPNRLVVDGGDWQYVAVVVDPTKRKKEATDEAPPRVA
jgi:hypothetical protein